MKIILFLSAFVFCGLCFGQLSQEAASAATDQVNTIMKDYTDTLITPTKGTDGIVVISLKALQSEKVAKLWTLIAASAVGKYFNDHPRLSVKEIWFSDVTDMKARPARYSVLQMEVAQRVQAEVFNGTMSLDEGQAKVWSSLAHKTKNIGP